MKLKCIAALCKGRKMVCIHSGNNSQYVGDGSACYLVPGELTLDRDNVLIIFDVPEDKQDSWTISSTGFPETISMADVLEGKEQALIYPVELCCGESTYRIIKDSCGIAAIDTRYLAPLADLKKGISCYIRRTDDGEEYIAVKAGLMLMAVIRASNESIFHQRFLDNLRDLQRECSRWISLHKERDPDEAQLYIDPETGEVEEEGESCLN